jgi:hypothetical protein
MATKLEDLLIDLSKDPFKAEEFRATPQGFLHDMALDESQQAALGSRNINAVEDMLAATRPGSEKRIMKNTFEFLKADVPETTTE